MTLSTQQRAELENNYRDGWTANYAGYCIDVQGCTASRYYERFKDEGVPRAPTKRKPRRGDRRYGCPVYTGPNMIGVPAQ